MKLVLSLVVLGFISVNARSRIAGGESTTIEQYPFAASLLSSYGGASYRHACGGTVITTGAILSAASCFFTGSNVHPATWWRVRVGSSNSDASGTIYLISNIIPHPSFSTSTLDNDIAVLRTSSSMQYSATVQPAALAGGVFSTSTYEEVWAIGWGATSSTGQTSSELRRVQFWIIDQQTCSNRYKELDFSVTSNMVCGGWQDVGIRGQCQGDAGSPLIKDGVVAGVFSWAEGCANGWYPNLNTRVSSYVWWIIRNV